MKKHNVAFLLSFLLVPVLLHARVEGHFDRTLTVSGVVHLDLTTGSGDITIKAGSSNQVVVHGTIPATTGSPAPTAQSTRSSPIRRFSRTATTSASAITCPRM